MPPLRTAPTLENQPVNISTRKIADVQLNNDYLRTDTDVSALKKSLESVGLIHPVTINPDNELLAGARRFQAASELGWEEIPVHIVDRDALVQELISIDETKARKLGRKIRHVL